MNIRARIKNSQYETDLSALKSTLLEGVARCGYTTKEEIGKLVELELRNHENVNLSSYDLQKLITFLYSSVNSFEIITDVFDNEDVDTIFVNSQNSVIAENKDGVRDLNITIADTDKFIEDIIKHCVYFKEEDGKIINAISPTGVRFHIVQSPVVMSSPVMVIKKFKPQVANFQSLIDTGFVSDKMADFLSAAVSAQKNIIIKGLPNSGKTTLLNAMASKIRGDQRVVLISNFSELVMVQNNIVKCKLNNINNSELLKLLPQRVIIDGCQDPKFITELIDAGMLGVIATMDNILLDKENIKGSVVVELRKLKDGTRKIISVTEGDEELFRFDSDYVEDGKVIGRCEVLKDIPKYEISNDDYELEQLASLSEELVKNN